MKSHFNWPSGPKVIKINSMLNSAEHGIYLAHKCLNANNCWHFNIYYHDKDNIRETLARNFHFCRYFSFYEQLRFCAQLS